MTVTVFSPEEWEIVQLSLKVSFAAMLFTLPLAFALAWVLARWRFPGKLLLDAAVHLPLVLPPVVIGWLLLLTLGPAGPVGSIMERWFGVTVMFRWTGAALAMVIPPIPMTGMRTADATCAIRSVPTASPASVLLPVA